MGPHPRVSAVQRWLAGILQDRIAPAAVRLELADGASTYASPEPESGALIVRDTRVILGLLVNSHLYFGEAYRAGRLDVRGGLERVVEAVSRLSLLPTSIELDEQLVYTCAYFEHPDVPLAQAQRAKLDLV